MVALNNERRKLNGAKKTTIYLNVRIYLAIKWAFKETDFSLIQLKRREEVEWEYRFFLTNCNLIENFEMKRSESDDRQHGFNEEDTQLGNFFLFFLFQIGSRFFHVRG